MSLESTAKVPQALYFWGRLFFRSGSVEGLSEPVMEFPAVLGVFLIAGLTAISRQFGVEKFSHLWPISTNRERERAFLEEFISSKLVGKYSQGIYSDLKMRHK